MGYSDEWKHILRDELPYYMDARIDNEPFPLVVHPKLIKELTKASGTLTFTPQILIDGITYHFKVSTIARSPSYYSSKSGVDYSTWHLWKTVRDTRPVAERQRTYDPRYAAGWYSSHIAVVTGLSEGQCDGSD